MSKFYLTYWFRFYIVWHLFRNAEVKAPVVTVALAFQAHMLAADNLDKRLFAVKK